MFLARHRASIGEAGACGMLLVNKLLCTTMFYLHLTHALCFSLVLFSLVHRKFPSREDVSNTLLFASLASCIVATCTSYTIPIIDVSMILNRRSNIQDYCKDRNVVIVGLPGAFTPT